MKIALVTRDNGVGLSVDVELLRSWLTDVGHDAVFVDWRARSMTRCDVVIFLELINPTLLRYARASVGIFNLEWFPNHWKRYLAAFTQVWAKSLESHEIFKRLGVASEYTGFLGRDMHDASVSRRLTCLHVRGKSSLKGTQAVLDAWRDYPDLPPLTVVSQDELAVPPGVRLLPRLSVDELRRELNAHRIHVCPSVSEGWGHYIAEGLSTGAVVITTDASPMNEHVQPAWGLLVPVSSTVPRHLATEHRIAPDALASNVRTAMKLSDDSLTAMGNGARGHFKARNDQFRSRAISLLETVMYSVPRAVPRHATVPATGIQPKFTSKRVRSNRTERIVKPQRSGAQMHDGADLVIVPAWRRADFLSATLSRLRSSDDDSVHYWIVLDRQHAPEVARVAEELQRSLGARAEVKRRMHRFYGNSFNLLTSYHEASLTNASLVHLVEEDIFIADGYFDFHRQAHALCPDAFAVSACRNQNVNDDPPEREDAVYHHNRYQSLAVSFRPQTLRDLVVPHVNSRYLNQPGTYLARTFPGSSITGFTEQDGLINRIVEAHLRYVVYPAVPRAYHAGFHGYNRNGKALNGSAEESGRQLLAMSTDELNARAESYRDHRVVDLDAARIPITEVIEWLP